MSVEPQSRARRKLAAAARRAARHLPPSLPPAFFVTDPERIPVPEKIAVGLPVGWGIIYRHFGAADREETAATLASICRERGLDLLIAADPALAMAVGAEGVHWPFRLRADMRRWTCRFPLQTVSAHSGAELRAAAKFPASAVLLSSVFPSRSPTAGKALGALRFRASVRASDLPVYALGGVNAANAEATADAGGFAAVEGMTPFGV